MNLSSRDLKLALQLAEVISSSLVLHEVLSRTLELLPPLLHADCGALCISKPGRLAEYDWVVTEGLADFLARYNERVDQDFVRPAVLRQPDVVLQDPEMLPRKELERSFWYQYSREQGLALEHVQSVMVGVDQQSHAGITMYRNRRRPFSERDRALLQMLRPSLANAIRNCRMLGEEATGRRRLEALFQRQGDACLVLVPPSREKMRTPNTTALLEKWFTPSDCDGAGLPRVLVEHLRVLTGMNAATRSGPDVWIRSGENENLVVRFVRLEEEDSSRPWALFLNELPQSLPLPEEMRRGLTAREVEIAQALLRNWANDVIARELRISPATVKTHVRNIFRKLKINDRADLMYQAGRLMKPI